MLLITKRLSFSAGHRLYDSKLSDEENIEIFGKCSYRGGHGHNYNLFRKLNSSSTLSERLKCVLAVCNG